MSYFKLKINVSNEAYNSKEQATAALSARKAKEYNLHNTKYNLHKMAWREQTVTVTQLSKLIQEGHTFCGLFNLPNEKVWIITGGRSAYAYPTYQRGANKGCMKIAFKRNAFYRGAQAIFVDIDKTAYTSQTKFIDRLTFKPTIAYYTYSDMQEDNGRRFRLVYVLDRVYDQIDIRSMAMFITSQIEKDTEEVMEDKCGNKPAQYFNGAYHTSLYMRAHNIYSITDFEQKSIHTIKDDIVSLLPDEDELSINDDLDDEEEDGKDNLDITVNNSKNKAQEAPKSSISDPLAVVDEQMVRDLKNMIYNHFMYQYGNDVQNYRIYFRTQYEWAEGQKYRVLRPEDPYLKLHYHHDRIEDEHKRRSTIYRRMCERIIMKPDVNINEIIYNAVYDMRYIIETDPAKEKGKDIPFENMNDIADFIVRNAKRAFREKKYHQKNFKKAIDYYAQHRPRIVLNDTIHFLNWRKELADARTIETDNMIAEVYDISKSVKDNWLAMKESGITIGMNRIYQWVRRYEIDTKIKSVSTKRKGADQREKRDKQLMAKYNLNLNERQNSQLLNISPSMAHTIKKKLLLSSQVS